jgi:hypothetical protein
LLFRRKLIGHEQTSPEICAALEAAVTEQECQAFRVTLLRARERVMTRRTRREETSC